MADGVAAGEMVAGAEDGVEVAGAVAEVAGAVAEADGGSDANEHHTMERIWLLLNDASNSKPQYCSLKHTHNQIDSISFFIIVLFISKNCSCICQ